MSFLQVIIAIARDSCSCADSRRGSSLVHQTAVEIARSQVGQTVFERKVRLPDSRREISQVGQTAVKKTVRGN